VYEFSVMRSVSKFFLPLLLAPAILTGAAHARTCNANNLANCNLTDGKVQYSNFSFSPGFIPNANDSFSLLGFADGSGSMAFNLDPGRNEVNASFTYTVTLLQGPQFTHAFRRANVGASGENIGAGVTIDTTLNASGLTQASYTRTGNTETAVEGVFGPGITSRTFTQSFSIVPAGNNDARLFTVSNDWNTNSEPIPGPLPLLGAVTAFGLSRKLRRRIRSAG
jgi:hypothetical protein